LYILLPVGESSTKPKVVTGPVLILPDIVARVVKFSDGSSRVETWDAGSCFWEIGEADAFNVMVKGSSLTPEELARRGIVS
jgi:hypothetical protein